MGRMGQSTHRYYRSRPPNQGSSSRQSQLSSPRALAARGRPARACLPPRSSPPACAATWRRPSAGRWAGWGPAGRQAGRAVDEERLRASISASSHPGRALFYPHFSPASPASHPSSPQWPTHLQHVEQHVQPLFLQEHEAQLRPGGRVLGGQLAEGHGDALLAGGLGRLHDIQDLSKDAGAQLVLQDK